MKPYGRGKKSGICTCSYCQDGWKYDNKSAERTQAKKDIQEILREIKEEDKFFDTEFGPMLKEFWDI